MGFFKKLFSPTQEEVDEGRRRQEEKLQNKEEALAEARRRVESWLATTPCPTHGSTHLTTGRAAASVGAARIWFEYIDKREACELIQYYRGKNTAPMVLIICRACSRITGTFMV